MRRMRRRGQTPMAHAAPMTHRGGRRNRPGTVSSAAAARVAGSGRSPPDGAGPALGGGAGPAEAERGLLAWRAGRCCTPGHGPRRGYFTLTFTVTVCVAAL